MKVKLISRLKSWLPKRKKTEKTKKIEEATEKKEEKKGFKGVLITVLVVAIIISLWRIIPFIKEMSLGSMLIWAGAILFIAIFGLRKIPNNPITNGQVTILGKIIPGWYVKEGWSWFLLPNFIHGYIEVDMTAKNQDFAPEDLLTPEDMAPIEIIVAATWRPAPDKLKNYLLNKGESGVRQILDDVVEEAIRERVTNPLKKPFTWEDAVKMKDVFLAEVAATIIGQEVETMPEDELKELARDLRRGNGSVKIPNLGIILSRVNVKSVMPPKNSELAKAAEQLAKEKREMEAEKVEIENVAARIQHLVETTHISPELAVEVVQTERKKVSKDIKQIKLDTGSLGDAVGKFLNK